MWNKWCVYIHALYLYAYIHTPYIYSIHTCLYYNFSPRLSVWRCQVQIRHVNRDKVILEFDTYIDILLLSASNEKVGYHRAQAPMACVDRTLGNWPKLFHAVSLIFSVFFSLSASHPPFHILCSHIVQGIWFEMQFRKFAKVFLQ